MNKDILRSIRRKTRIRKKLNDVKNINFWFFVPQNIFTLLFLLNKMIKHYVLTPR